MLLSKKWAQFESAKTIGSKNNILYGSNVNSLANDESRIKGLRDKDGFKTAEGRKTEKTKKLPFNQRYEVKEMSSLNIFIVRINVISA